VTDIVRVIPPPVTVIVPVRLVVFVLAVALSVSVPLFVPLPGETVSHCVALLEAVHVTFDVTLTVVFPAVAGGFHVVDDTASVGGATTEEACVTMTSFVRPPPETVILPVRLVGPVLAVTTIEKKPLPVPEPP